MKKLRLTDNQWRWVWVIGLIIFPVILIHWNDHEVIPRLVSVIFLLMFLPLFFFVVGLISGIRIISNAPRLKEKYSEKSLRKWDIALKILGITFACLVLYYETIPLLRGAHRLIITHEPMIIVEGSLENQQSVFGAVFLYWRFDVKETGDHLVFFYPNMIRSTGEKYRFSVLPGTNFVLDSEEL